MYPINAMGITKAMMEKLTIAKSRVAADRGVVLCVTRYGNVMGSRGSVIPLFIKQIREGGPLTVTDPGMTRFMMSIEDAVELVLYAFEHGTPGDTFVQKAPAATIETLVVALKRIFEAPNPTHRIGTRHGEKLYESLLTREEMARAEDRGGYYRVPSDSRDLDYAKYFVQGTVPPAGLDDYHLYNTHRLGVEELTDLLLGLDFVQSALAEWRR